MDGSTPKMNSPKTKSSDNKSKGYPMVRSPAMTSIALKDQPNKTAAPQKGKK